MLKRFWSMFKARNKEFFRDRANLGWNFIFPFLLIIGFAALFQRGGQEHYKIGIIPGGNASVRAEIPEALKTEKMVKPVFFPDAESGLEKLRFHKIDLVLETGQSPMRYWINETSPRGRIAESLLVRLLSDPGFHDSLVKRQTVTGDRIDYIEWLFPGILAMNMMFSGLYGAGYAIVRYRKNGVLKRLKATPLGAVEYLSAQVLSRLFVILFTGVVLYTGCAWIMDFNCKGSLLDLFLVFTTGAVAVIALGLVVAARTASEELANGLLNTISWPMMFLSEVWFSIEGASEWVRRFSELLPLTHVTEGMRRIMNEGAGLTEIRYHLICLLVMGILFMVIGAVTFKWTSES